VIYDFVLCGATEYTFVLFFSVPFIVVYLFFLDYNIYLDTYSILVFWIDSAWIDITLK
jgi:hypothetical protein